MITCWHKQSGGSQYPSPAHAYMHQMWSYPNCGIQSSSICPLPHAETDLLQTQNEGNITFKAEFVCVIYIKCLCSNKLYDTSYFLLCLWFFQTCQIFLGVVFPNAVMIFPWKNKNIQKDHSVFIIKYTNACPMCRMCLTKYQRAQF